MVQKTIYVCDRCDKEFDVTKTYKIQPVLTLIISEKVKDLCPSCLKELIDWFIE